MLPAAEVASENTDTAAAALQQAKSLRQRAQSLLAKKIEVSDAEEIRVLMGQSLQAVEQKDWGSLAGCNERMSDVLFYLED